MTWTRSLAVVLLVCLGASGRPLAQAPEAAAPADVVYERLASVVAFDRDGTSVETRELTMRVNTVAGLEAVGTISLPYMRDMATLKVDYVRVRKATGGIVDTPVASGIDQPAEITTEAPTFTDLYVKHINVQGLEVGDRVEYAYTMRESSLIPGHFWHETSFDPASVILDQSLEVSWPSSIKATVKTTTGATPSRTSAGGREIYRWQYRNPVALDRNALVLRYFDRRQVRADVQVSSFASWSEVGQAMQALWRDRASVTTEIRERARALTASATTPEDRAKALYAFVATNVRYVAVNMGVGRLRPHSAAEVLAAGFGDCKDKHTLLVALLAAVGIDAEAALIGPGVVVDPDVPSPGHFTHVITHLPSIGSAGTWLDSTLGVAPFGQILAEERDAYVLRVPAKGDSTLLRTPNTPARANVWRRDVTGTLDDAGTLQATVRETFSGDLEVGMRTLFRLAPRARWTDVVKAFPLAATHGGVVTEVNTSAPDDTKGDFEISYRYRVADYSDWKNKRVYAPAMLRLPEELSTERPAVPVALDVLDQVTTARIELARGVTASLPASVKPELVLERAYGRYQSKVDIAGQVVTTERRWTSTAKEVPASAIEEFRAFTAEVRNADYHVNLAVRTPWAWTSTAEIDWYRGASPAATKTLQTASTTARRRDYQEAMANVRALLKAEPDNDAAWLMLAYVELSSGDRVLGLDTLRRRAALGKSAPILKYFAERLTSFGVHDEALSVWERGRKLFPEDDDFALYLGESLIRARRYAEAADTLTAVAEGQAKSARFHFSLGQAQLLAARNTEGIESLRRSAELDSSSTHLNRVAWELASRKAALDTAKTYVERAIRDVTGEINKAPLATVELADVRRPQQLAAFWDTLGWILHGQGDTAGAEKWLRAAWSLGGDREVASHLAEVYAAAGNSIEGQRFAGYAAALPPPGASQITDLRTTTVNAAAEMTRERTVTLPRPAAVTAAASAELLLVVKASGQVADVRVIRGDASQSALTAAVRDVTVNWTPPDATLTQVIRRASVQCPATGACAVVLHRPGDVSSIQ